MFIGSRLETAAPIGEDVSAKWEFNEGLSVSRYNEEEENKLEAQMKCVKFMQ